MKYVYIYITNFKIYRVNDIIFLKTKKYTHAREKIINVLTNTPHTLQSAIVLCTKSHGVNYVRNIYISCVFLIFLLPKNPFKREVLWRIKYARSVFILIKKYSVTLHFTFHVSLFCYNSIFTYTKTFHFTFQYTTWLHPFCIFKSSFNCSSFWCTPKYITFYLCNCTE